MFNEESTLVIEAPAKPMRARGPQLGLIPRPLRTSFVITSMEVGGAETLLVNLMRGFDRDRIDPELICLKDLGPLGKTLEPEFPTRSNVLTSKWDLRVLPRLAAHFRRQKTDAVVTVGAGDKMFWGRLSAWLAGVPVIASALHSTGWPDGVGRMNRTLTRITHCFIAVAQSHGEFLVDFERFPRHKVHVIRNGIDTQRFAPQPACREEVRRRLNVPIDSKLIGIVAALRPEKNHELFLHGARLLRASHPNSHFVIIGDGPQRSTIQQKCAEWNLTECVHLLGNRNDTPFWLAGLDAFALTSHNEANPVSILESLSCGVPVVATDVGSVAETVIPGETGFLIEPGNAEELASQLGRILDHPTLGKTLGARGRQCVVRTGSLDSMVQGYTDLICNLHYRNTSI
jgi:glycosyltransferase involved in cell wall biosynthesis